LQILRRRGGGGRAVSARGGFRVTLVHTGQHYDNPMSCVVAYRASGPYGDPDEQDPRVSRVYDPATGKLTMVAYAADGSLRLDHWWC